MATFQTELQGSILPDTNGSLARNLEKPAAWGFESDLYHRLMVEPGSDFSLGNIDPNYCGDFTSYERLIPVLQGLAEKINRLQHVMYAECKHSLLIVLQSLDAGGKDGVVRHLLRTVNPAGCRMAAFKQPTRAELAHDFLWRIHQLVPARGEIAVFNRSHYEDVLVARVHQLVPAVVWSNRYRLINDFENLLHIENNTTILKFFLYISKDEQLARFKLRLDDPLRRWKISEADYLEREYWDEYTTAFNEMLKKTSTWHAPWFVVPSNNKSFRDLAVSQITLRTLEDLNMKLPEPAADLAEIRRRYHDAEAALGGGRCQSSPQKKRHPFHA